MKPVGNRVKERVRFSITLQEREEISYKVRLYILTQLKEPVWSQVMDMASVHRQVKEQLL